MPRSRLEVVGVHDADGHLLVLTEGARLAQHVVDQRCLAVVDVGNDRNVADVRHFGSYGVLYSANSPGPVAAQGVVHWLLT